MLLSSHPGSVLAPTRAVAVTSGVPVLHVSRHAGPEGLPALGRRGGFGFPSGVEGTNGGRISMKRTRQATISAVAATGLLRPPPRWLLDEFFSWISSRRSFLRLPRGSRNRLGAPAQVAPLGPHVAKRGGRDHRTRLPQRGLGHGRFPDEKLIAS